ncbi:DUF6042 family protein [Amycolatopsis sp. TNS106]|uniref:DUF6042 family protein n=1 Tax=Amycolatopsis sp. TNS106 TaxID=2861750 RepID=UPI001C570272|nr:DUF6042 family protein [Amycolatopsis sp. TNS106]QXV57444.1 hypothetical protein CVV72_10875 [Amycolatopsis sp. TNS106]
MVNERVRKKKIRAHMAATGRPYLRAARDLDDSGSGFSYLRTDWSNSAWPRLMPLEAMTLELIIGTASVTDQDGDLADLIAAHPASSKLDKGPDTVLTWQYRDEEDAETAALRAEAQAAFTDAVTTLGRPVPTTLADLAHLLAELGVYQHTREPDGKHRWRAPQAIPRLQDVLPLPCYWTEREDRVRWFTETSGAALTLQRSLRGHHGEDQVDTTMQRLGDETGMPIAAVRAGLDGLMYRFNVEVLRHETPVTREDLDGLAEHARIRLVIDWTNFETSLDPDQDDDEDMQLVWDNAPWSTYRAIAADAHIIDGAHEVLGHMPFTISQPDGNTFSTSLADLAIGNAMSTGALADSFLELEKAGLLRWSAERQLAEMAEVPNKFTTA